MPSASQASVRSRRAFVHRPKSPLRVHPPPPEERPLRSTLRVRHGPAEERHLPSARVPSAPRGSRRGATPSCTPSRGAPPQRRRADAIREASRGRRRGPRSRVSGRDVTPFDTAVAAFDRAVTRAASHAARASRLSPRRYGEALARYGQRTARSLAAVGCCLAVDAVHGDEASTCSQSIAATSLSLPVMSARAAATSAIAPARAQSLPGWSHALPWWLAVEALCQPVAARWCENGNCKDERGESHRWCRGY